MFPFHCNRTNRALLLIVKYANRVANDSELSLIAIMSHKDSNDSDVLWIIGCKDDRK